MITLNCIYILFKKIIAIVSAIMLMIVGAGEKNLPEPDAADIINKNVYVLTDAKVSSQGVTNDGEYFYFSGNKDIGKADMKTGNISKITISAIPKELKDKGCNHIGGLSYHDGMIYAAVEDGPDYNNSFIVLYDADTLKYTGVYYELPHELHLEGVPWCAIDEQRNYLYTAEWSNATVLNVFNLDDLSLVKIIPLSEPIDRIQGAEMYDGTLYMSCDEENDMKRIMSLNVETGLVKTVFARNVGKVFEAEDLTVFKGDNGKAVFAVLDRGEKRKSINLTFYQISE